MAKFTVYQNQSLSWRGNQIFFLTMLCISFTIASAFAWQGFWLVLPFAGIEMAALGFALYFCMRRLSRVETVTVFGKSILVRVRQCNRVQAAYILPKAWTRAVVLSSPSTMREERLCLSGHRAEIEIGSFLNDSEKHRLAEAINKAILRH